MIPIPEELLEQVERGNVLLFIGERIVRDAAGQAVLDRLTAQLADRCGIRDEEDLSFPEVAQVYEEEKGRQALVQFMRDQLEELDDEPQRVHRLIAGLTDCKVLVTTCIDQYLERAFEEAGRPLDVITGSLDVAFEDERKARLYKLRGSVERVDSLVLTEDQHETFFEDQTSISVMLQAHLTHKAILFAGYDLADPHFKRLYRKVTAYLDDYARRSYMFGETPSPIASRWCKRHGIDIVEADATAFLEALTRQLEARARPAPAGPARPVEEPMAPLPERPYKLLDYYEATDAAIFFGRQQETQTLSSLIHAHRLVLLYGASGVGKTSLLLAGAVPRLERTEPPYETICVRALEDPTLVVRRAVRRLLPEADLREDSSLVDFLDAATKALDNTLVIVLDQFEEFFIRLSPQSQAAFIAELGALYDARDVPIKVVLSLREDWLASVSEIEKRIPEVFRTKMRLLPLTRDQARQAITAPVERLEVSYDPALVDRLLDDLTGSEGAAVMPPQLQLVCSALYDGLKPDERRITLGAYQRLGGARGVLQKYLADELTRLGRDERVRARHALEELVTSQGTKAVKAPDELAVTLEVNVYDLEPVLEKLVRARLLRRLKCEDGGSAYELAHEYLIHEIHLDPETQKRKRIEELIKWEVKSRKEFGTLMTADELARVDEVRDALRLNAEAQDLLLRSALQVGHEVNYWLSRVSDPGQRLAVLAEAARSKLVVVRQRAAEALGTQDMSNSVEPLLDLAVYDDDSSVRVAAQESLSKLTEQRPTAVARLRSVTRSANRVARRAALETLAALPLGGLPADLRAQVLTTRIRLHAARLMEWSLATPWRRTVALTAVLLLTLVALAYAFSVSSYYVDIRPSPVSGQLNDLIIRRGYPLLKLPGLGQEVVDTGMNTSQVAGSHWNDVLDERLWGLWGQRSDEGYRKWGQDVATALSSEYRIPLLWYLNQDAGLKAVLEAMLSPSKTSRVWDTRALEQVLTANPELAPQVVESLLERLSDQEKLVRSMASRGLGLAAVTNGEVAPQTAEALVDLLTDKDAIVRYDAARALGQIGAANPKLAPYVTESLTRLLTDQEHGVRRATVETLGQMGVITPEAVTSLMVEALAGLLTDEDSEMRYSAVKALGQVKAANPEVALEIAQVLVGLLTDENSEVRRFVAGALGQVGTTYPEAVTPQIVEALAGLLTDEDNEVRYDAVKALAQMGVASPEAASQVAQTLTGLLSDEDSEVLYSTVEALVQVGGASPEVAPQVAQTLLELLTDEDNEVRYNAVEALVQVGAASPEVAPQVAQTLTGLLTDEDSEVRYSAVQALAQVGAASPEAAPQVARTLVELLTDGDNEMRYSAVRALAEMGAASPEAAPRVVKALVKLLTGEDRDLRGSAVDALGQVGAANPEVAPQVAEALVGLLTDRNKNVRYGALEALEQMAAANPEVALKTAQVLVGLLADKTPEVRGRAVKSLGRLGAGNPEVAPQMAEALIRLLADENTLVRREAQQALGRIGIANPEVAHQVAEALIGLLADEDRLMRRDALEALGQVGAANPEVAPQVAEALVGLLADEADEIRFYAVKAWGMVIEANPDVATPQVVEALVGLLTTDEHLKVRQGAAETLIQVGVANPETVTPQMAAALTKLLTEEDSKTRAGTVEALAQIYAHQAIQPDRTDEMLFTKLTDPLHAQERPIAARALFLVVLHDPTSGQAIRGHLETLAVSHEPIARIWANTTLQMINLADLVHMPIDTSAQWEEITDKLDRLTDADFFGVDHAWAAQEALHWLRDRLPGQLRKR